MSALCASRRCNNVEYVETEERTVRKEEMSSYQMNENGSMIMPDMILPDGEQIPR